MESHKREDRAEILKGIAIILGMGVLAKAYQHGGQLLVDRLEMALMSLLVSVEFGCAGEAFKDWLVSDEVVESVLGLSSLLFFALIPLIPLSLFLFWWPQFALWGLIDKPLKSWPAYCRALPAKAWEWLRYDGVVILALVTALPFIFWFFSLIFIALPVFFFKFAVPCLF